MPSSLLLEECFHPNAEGGEGGEGGEIQDTGDPENDDDDTGSSNYSSEFATPEGYQHWKTECNPDDWVGPITGFLELYRYNRVSKTAEMDGPRFVSLCVCSRGSLLTLLTIGPLSCITNGRA